MCNRCWCSDRALWRQAWEGRGKRIEVPWPTRWTRWRLHMRGAWRDILKEISRAHDIRSWWKVRVKDMMDWMTIAVRVKRRDMFEVEEKGQDGWGASREEIKSGPPLTLTHHYFLLGTFRRMCVLGGGCHDVACPKKEKMEKMKKMWVRKHL